MQRQKINEWRYRKRQLENKRLELQNERVKREHELRMAEAGRPADGSRVSRHMFRVLAHFIFCGYIEPHKKVLPCIWMHKKVYPLRIS